MSILVEEGGLFTTIQDLGRRGFLHQGVLESGAMDRRAARNANIAVANDEKEAVLEMTLIGPVLTFQTTALICMTGDGMTPFLNGDPYPIGYPLVVPKGTTLSFKAKKEGMRTYLAVAGGFNVPDVMDSKSTYIRAGIGGYQGRSLKQGDCLELGSPNKLVQPVIEKTNQNNQVWRSSWHVNGPINEAHELNRNVIRAIPGTHFERLNEESKRQLFQTTFTVKNQSDRMGYRLQSQARIQFDDSFSLLSEAVALGTVQAPPDGQLIILMADRQTTGGYPRALQVTSVDIWKIAQLRPGQSFTFTKVSLEEAERLYVEYERATAIRKQGILLKWKQCGSENE
ncbi:biotin-dependent carboxyltransferase family protein [Shouchella lehensis]|uniref:Allophanate hydrolase subunit 2 n=1 Tax=Shouchella lehensis G1 TaxID=1246626 RepID=A0A060LS08_9BACI|nr:biotin-dependent carboxyltransferase family protein [Shouchella lehensis]AIC92810.1 allophanate hydrolase subunit 2 [Shouchella lehensis G1]